MRKLVIVLTVLLLNAFVGFGQVKFFKIYTNDGYDYGEGVVQLNDSSYLVTGSSSSFSDSPAQAFLLKLDKNGDYVWSRNYGGTESDWGRRVLNWNDSIFYITGYSNSLGTGSYNAYLVKTDKDGNELVQKHYNHPGWDKVNDALLTADSMIYMVGETTGTANGDQNFYIIKTDKNGDTLWTRNFGSAGEDGLQSIHQFDVNTFYAVGNKFNVDSTYSKGVLVKFDKDGNVLLEKEFGPNGSYHLYDFYFRFGTIYAVGKRQLPQSDEIDEYRVQMSYAGAVLWEASDQSSGTTIYDHVMPYGTGGKVFLSSFHNDELSASSSFDADITRFYDNLIWDAAFCSVGFPGADRNEELALTNDEGVVVVGYMTMPGMGGSSVFVYKVGPNADFPIINLNDISSNEIYNLVNIDEENSDFVDFTVFPNPTSGLLQFKSNQERAIHLIDLNGRMLEEYHIENGSTIDVSSFTKGMYYLRVVQENKVVKSIKLCIY
jgi:hypothetical protein